MLKVLRQVVGIRRPELKPSEKTLFIDRHAVPRRKIIVGPEFSRLR